MPFEITKPGSDDYEHVRYLIAIWSKPGIAFLGGHTSAPVATCCILLETGVPDEILLEDGTGCVALEAC